MFFNAFIGKLSTATQNSSIEIEQIDALQHECVDLLCEYNAKTPTSYNSQRTLVYFKLRISQILKSFLHKKKNTI